MAAFVNPETAALCVETVPAGHVSAAAIVEFPVFNQKYPPQCAFGDDFLQFFQYRMMAQIKAHHNIFAGFFRRADDVLTAFYSYRQRFVNQYIDPVVQSRDRIGFMAEVRAGNYYRIEFFSGDHGLDGIIKVRSETQVFGGKFHPDLVGITQRHHLCVFARCNRFAERHDPSAAGSDNTYFEFLVTHFLSFCFRILLMSCFIDYIFKLNF